MQVDAGTFITDIEDHLKEQLGGVNEQHSSYDVTYMFTRAALAAMVKHSRTSVGGVGMLDVPAPSNTRVQQQTKENLLGKMLSERGRKAADTRARNKAAKAAAAEQEKTQGQGSGQPPTPTPTTNGPEHHTRRTFGGAPVSPLAPSAPTGGDGGAS